MKRFDVDIDLPSTVDKNTYGIRGMVYNEKTETCSPHPSCYYLQEVPVDGLTGTAAFDYEEEFTSDLLKVDLLTNRVYDGVNSKEELLGIIERPVDWSMFLDKEIVEKLPHIAKYHDLVKQVKPQSVEDLADVIALIRPGKSHLIETYLENKKIVRRDLYKRAANEQAYFKKSHAISYALMIVCALHLIDTGIRF